MLVQQVRGAPVRRGVLVARCRCRRRPRGLSPRRVDGPARGERGEVGRRARPVRPLLRRQSDLEVAAARVVVARLHQVGGHAALLRRLGPAAGRAVLVIPAEILMFSN